MVRKVKGATNHDISIGLLIFLLIVSLGVAIVQRMVTDGVLTLFSQVEQPVILEKETVTNEVDKLLETVVVPVEAAPLVEGKVRFVKVTDGCAYDYGDSCLRVRSGPGTEYESVAKLRTGIVLRSDETIEVDGKKWHKIMFDEWLRYPERVEGEWYVSGEYVEVFYDEGTMEYSDTAATGTKSIIVDRSDQTLKAYDGEELFMEAEISTGLELTPTPRGTFFIFRKTPSRYMQGPLPYLVDQQYYDLPGVPWTLYFTEGGAAIHGTYWHNNFGNAQSHGCVNLRPEEAEKLYRWAELGMKVVVRD